ncbi:MAG: tetratricopeptide repeat protein [bacterium]|nr:tetratricopeptide repeat protein [bacterium]
MDANRKNVKLFFIGVISFILLSGFTPDEIREKLEKGDELVSEKKYTEADKILNEVLREVNKENPNPQEELSKNIVVPRIYFSLGDSQNKQEKYENAKSYFEKIVNSQFRSYWDVKAIYNIGLIDYGLKNYKEARGSFNRVLTEYPDSEEAPQAQYYIGLCYELEGLNTEAIKSYENFLKLYPEHLWAEKVKAKLNKQGR